MANLSRLSTYGLLTVGLTGSVVSHAWSQQGQFYTTCIHLTRSNTSMMVCMKRREGENSRGKRLLEHLPSLPPSLLSLLSPPTFPKYSLKFYIFDAMETPSPLSIDSLEYGAVLDHPHWPSASAHLLWPAKDPGSRGKGYLETERERYFLLFLRCCWWCLAGFASGRDRSTI